MKEKALTHFEGFMNFIREQGVMGLAIGFVLGGSVSKVVTSLVQDIINPVLGIVLGANDGLAKASLEISSIKIMWGHFLSVVIDFAIIALVVYFGFKVMGLDKLDKKKDAK
ncbi:MscL family protein [Candidatus Woesebacteria bacterium]|jgi:large conductance mechanosensitive channel|nr:MscL family protein [Candidatus Woesebacteria bacterium]